MNARVLRGLQVMRGGLASPRALASGSALQTSEAGGRAYGCPARHLCVL